MNKSSLEFSETSPNSPFLYDNMSFITQQDQIKQKEETKTPKFQQKQIPFPILKSPRGFRLTQKSIGDTFSQSLIKNKTNKSSNTHYDTLDRIFDDTRRPTASFIGINEDQQKEMQQIIVNQIHKKEEAKQDSIMSESLDSTNNHKQVTTVPVAQTHKAKSTQYKNLSPTTYLSLKNNYRQNHLDSNRFNAFISQFENSDFKRTDSSRDLHHETKKINRSSTFEMAKSDNAFGNINPNGYITEQSGFSREIASAHDFGGFKSDSNNMESEMYKLSKSKSKSTNKQQEQRMSYKTSFEQQFQSMENMYQIEQDKLNQMKMNPHSTAQQIEQQTYQQRQAQLETSQLVNQYQQFRSKMNYSTLSQFQSIINDVSSDDDYNSFNDKSNQENETEMIGLESQKLTKINHFEQQKSLELTPFLFIKLIKMQAVHGSRWGQASNKNKIFVQNYKQFSEDGVSNDRSSEISDLNDSDTQSPQSFFKRIQSYKQLDSFSQNLYLYVKKYAELISPKKQKKVFSKYIKMNVLVNSINNMNFFVKELKRSGSFRQTKLPLLEMNEISNSKSEKQRGHWKQKLMRYKPKKKSTPEIKRIISQIRNQSDHSKDEVQQVSHDQPLQMKSKQLQEISQQLKRKSPEKDRIMKIDFKQVQYLKNSKVLQRERDNKKFKQKRLHKIELSAKKKSLLSDQFIDSVNKNFSPTQQKSYIAYKKANQMSISSRAQHEITSSVQHEQSSEKKPLVEKQTKFSHNETEQKIKITNKQLNKTQSFSSPEKQLESLKSSHIWLMKHNKDKIMRQKYRITRGQMIKKIRDRNLKRFRSENPEFRALSDQQIILIFDLYKSNMKRSFSQTNISFLVGGTLIILICSLFMNACSSLVSQRDYMKKSYDPNKVVMNTIISSGASGLFIVIQNHWHNVFINDEKIKETGLIQQFDIHQVCGGVLAGLISITGSSANVSLLSAAIIGLIGSGIYTQTKRLMERAEIDDPLDNSEIHGFCGIWSILAVGIFDQDEGLIFTGNMEQLAIQALGAIAYIVWSILLSYIFFYGLKINGRLRCKAIYEIIGQDFMQHQSSEQSVNISLVQDLERNYRINRQKNMRQKKYL